MRLLPGWTTLARRSVAATALVGASHAAAAAADDDPLSRWDVGEFGPTWKTFVSTVVEHASWFRDPVEQPAGADLAAAIIQQVEARLAPHGFALNPLDERTAEQFGYDAQHAAIANAIAADLERFGAPLLDANPTPEDALRNVREQLRSWVQKQTGTTSPRVEQLGRVGLAAAVALGDAEAFHEISKHADIVLKSILQNPALVEKRHRATKAWNELVSMYTKRFDGPLG